MSDDAETERRKSNWPYWLIGIGTVISLVIAIVVIVEVTEPVQYNTGQRLTPIPSSTQVEEPPPSISVAAPEPPPLPQDFVAQAMPTSFMVTRDGEPLIQPQPVARMERKQYGNDYLLAIPGDSVAVINDPGVDWAGLPGSVADKTVHILGHTNRDPPMVFNPLAMHDPMTDSATYRTKITLPGGVVTYEYVQTHPVSKGALWNKLQELSGHPGRVLVVMCRLEVVNGQLLNTNEALIWEFQFQSSQAN